MKKSSIVWLVVVVVILGIWWYLAMRSGSGSMNMNDMNATSTMATTTPNANAPINIVVLNTTSTTALGTFLTAPNGMTLYKYTPDTPGVSNCTGPCTTLWPAYTVPASEASSSLVATGAIGQVGVIPAANGTFQVTYNGMPLYFYAKDTTAGQTNGQGLGGVWFVVNP